MDHYIPKRRIPVRLWSADLQGVDGDVFLNLDPAGSRHQTVLYKLNETARFLPVAMGEQGRIHLFNKARIARVTAALEVLQSDLYTRGFQPSREEDAEVWFNDGTSVQGRIWMPLERPTQRVSDYMNQRGWEFFVLLAPGTVQLVNASLVARMQLVESAGGPFEWASMDASPAVSGVPGWE